MTTQTSYSKKEKSTDMSVKYFLGELKRSWPQAVLFMIIFILSMIVPLLMNNLGHIGYSTDMPEAERIARSSARILNLLTEYVQIWTLVSMIAAFISGLFVTRILNNKVSADFYHSIPIRRENLYLARLGVGFTNYFITFLAAVLTVLVIAETQTLAPTYGALIFKRILRNFGYALLAFAMVYSTTVFAGMLCGTSSMHILMTLYVNLITVICYSSFFMTLEVFMSNFNAYYYLEGTFPSKLVPAVRLLSLESIRDIGAHELWFYVIGSLLLFMGALALYKFRRIERAGTPVVFDGFAAFLRYSVILPVTLLGGLFFKLLVDSIVWYFIGLIIGAFLCFLLVNTILSKNARKMFSGIKSFAIYAAIMIVVFLSLGFDVFKLDEYIPEEGSIKSVNIVLSNEIVDIDFKDKEVISKTIELDRSSADVFRNNYDENSIYSVVTTAADREKYYDKDVSFYDTAYHQVYYLEIVYTPNFGIPIARRVTVYQRSDKMDAFAKAIADSEDYENYYNERLSDDKYSDYNINYDAITESANINNEDYNYDNYNSPFGKNPEDALKKIYNGNVEIDYDYFQRQQIGQIHFYGYNLNNYRNFRMPVFIDDSISDVLKFNRSDDEYYEFIASNINYLAIIKGDVDLFNEEDENVLIIIDRHKIIEIIKNCTSIVGRESVFTKKEPLYHIGICYNSSNDYNGKYPVSKITTSFLYGKVPSFIAESFK